MGIIQIHNTITLHTLMTHNMLYNDHPVTTRAILMRPGIVVQVRINPSTAQSVLDVLELAGMESKDKSFSVCVSAALNILVDTAKASGLITEPDPYQFTERLKYHVGQQAPDRRKMPKKNIGPINPTVFPQHSQALPTYAKVAPVEAPPIDVRKPADPMELMEYQVAIKRLTDAQMKKDLAEDGTEGVVWSAKDEADFQRDVKIVYPDG